MFVVFCIISGSFLSHRAQKILDDKWALFSRSLAAKKIEVSRPTVVFARSGLPMLGASIEKLSHSGVSRCFEYQIKAEQLFLPLNLTQILLGRLKLGTLEVEKTHLQIQESLVCSDTPQAKHINALKTDFEDVISAPTQQKNPEFFAHFTRWFSEHQPRLSTMPLRHFYLKKIEIQGETLKEKHVQGLGSLTIDLDDDVDSDEMVAQLNFEKLVLGKTTRSVATQFHARIQANAETILLSGDWAYYEGHLRLAVDFNKSEKISVSLKSQNLPLSVVNRWFDTPWTFQFVWFNCGLSLQNQSSQWQETPWVLEPCQITGPHGGMEVTSKNVKSLANVNDLQVILTNIQLDRILKGKEHLPLSGVIKDYGTLSGHVGVIGSKVDGQLQFKDASLLFSRKNKRLLQVLDEVQLGLSYENSHYTFSVADMKIRDGKFSGSAEAAYYKKQQKMIAQIRVPQISFSPEIQKLMLSGELSPLAIEGEAEWLVDSGDGVNGKFQIAWESYKHTNLSVNKGKALLGWVASVPQLALTADQVTVERNDSTLWMFASVLEEETRQQIRFQQVYLSGEVLTKNKFDIKKSTAFAPALGRLSLVGQLDFIEGQGQARWQLVSGQAREWEWSFRAQDLSWIPQTKPMRDWLQQHEEYLSAYPFVR